MQRLKRWMAAAEALVDEGDDDLQGCAAAAMTNYAKNSKLYRTKR
jgi:hypothetical protein